MLSVNSITEALKDPEFGNFTLPSLSTTSALYATATATTSLLYTAIATATATTTVSTSVANPTPTLGAAAVTSASQAVPTGNQVLSEELQKLIQDYLVLADTIEKELDSLKASPTFTTRQPERTKQHRRIQYAKDT